MTVDEKNRILSRIEYILSYLLSRKHNMNVKIEFKRIGEKENEK